MTIFAVLMPTPQPSLTEEIKKSFPNDYLSLNDTQYLVSSSGTVAELTAKVGIWDPANPTAPATGIAVVVSISSYSGRASPTVWEWLKTKLESRTSA